MKRLTLILATIALMACGTQAQKTEKTPWPVEPRNEQVEYMLLLDSVNYARMGDSRNHTPIELEALAALGEEPMTTEEMDSMLNKTYDDAEELWHKFVWLCNEERQAEAVQLYRDNQIMIDLALTDSEVRLAFHDEILGFLAYDHLPDEEARELMIECFQFDFTMLGVQYVATGDEDYYSGLYDYAFQMLDTLYEQTDYYADMITYIDSWAKTLKAVRYHPSTDVTAFARKGYVYMTIGNYEKTLSSYSEAKRLVEEAIASGDNHSALADWLKMLNEQISECQKEMVK
jgi:tetratricopeptide (TPR) repeat protein